MARSRTATIGLLARQFASSPGASAALALVVLVVALVATATPRAVESLFTAGIRHELALLPPTSRDVVATEVGGPVAGAAAVVPTGMTADAGAVFGAQADALAGMRDGMPNALRTATSDGRFVLTFDPLSAPFPYEPHFEVSSRILLGFDPWLESHIRVVDGALPVPVASDWPGDSPLEIVLSTATATWMVWPVGEERELQQLDGSPTVRLVGTYEAVDPTDPFWSHSPSTLTPEVVDPGIGGKLITGVALAAPGSWPRVIHMPLNPRLHAWFPVKANSLDSAQAASFSTGVRAFSREVQPNGPALPCYPYCYRNPGDPIQPVPGFAFDSDSAKTVDAELTRSTATTSVLAMVAAGPVGVVLAVLLLAVRLLTARRARAIGIASARGASALRLRTTLAVEGLLLGLPSALVGAIAGIALTVGASFSPPLLVAPLLIGLVPAILLASRPLGVRRAERADLDGAGLGRLRWIAELAIIGIAVLSVVLLGQRGIPTGTRVAFDPLLVATPLLLTLAACVIVLRLYPLPLAGVLRSARPRPGLVAFLGAARGLRDQAAGLAPVLAMLVAVSITVFSGVLLATTSHGIDEAANEKVGSDVSVTALGFQEDELDRLRSQPGVGAFAAVAGSDDEHVRIDGDLVSIATVAVDTTDLQAVQRGMAAAVKIPVSLTARTDGTIPVIVSEKLATLIGDGEISLRGTKFVVVGTTPDLNPFTTRETWLLSDATNVDEVMESGTPPRQVLATARAGTTPDQLGRQLKSDGAVVETRTALANELRSNPSIYGLSAALVIAIILLAFLAAAAVVLTLVLGSRAREQLLANLRTLGITRRRERAILGWEIGPIAIVTLVVGVIFGMVLPSVVLPGVDLEQFTGGSRQPTIVLDPAVPGLVVIGFALLVVVATLLAAALGSRRTVDGLESDD